MKTAIFFSAVLVARVHSAATSGCGNSLPARVERGGADDTNSLEFTTSDGTVREYGLHIPTSYDSDEPAPLAFSFHGQSRVWQEQESICGMSNETLNPNYLVVYPQGIDRQWQGAPEASGYDDVSFTLELVANLSSTYCLDTNKIYAAGKSNGGAFSANILACHAEASRTFAAFGGISGAYYQGDSDDDCHAASVPIPCNASRPVPIFTTHGDDDDTIPYDGGPRRDRCLPSLPHFMTHWSDRNGFGTSNTSTTLQHKDVVRYEYGNETYPDFSVHYHVHDLGHDWPSLANGSSIDATPLLFDFWSKWTLDAVNTTSPATPSSSGTPPASSTTSTSSASSSSAGEISSHIGQQQWVLGGFLGVVGYLLI